MKYKMPKSLREKKRYIKFKLEGGATLGEEEVRRLLWNTVITFLGEKGAAGANLWVSEWKGDESVGVLKCSIDAVDDVIVALKMVTEVEGERANIMTLGVSGTIKSLESC